MQEWDNVARRPCGSDVFFFAVDLKKYGGKAAKIGLKDVLERENARCFSLILSSISWAEVYMDYIYDSYKPCMIYEKKKTSSNCKVVDEINQNAPPRMLISKRSDRSGA